MLQRFKHNLKLTEGEHKRLMLVAERSINQLRPTMPDMRFMMHYYYRQYAYSASIQHLNRQIDKKIACADCRAIVMKFIEKWYESERIKEKEATANE